MFDAIGEQIGCTGEELRQNTANAMQRNHDRLAATMYDVQYLERNYNQSLYTGGARRAPRSNEQRNSSENPTSEPLAPAIKLSFEDKHLRPDDAIDDSASTNENQSQTTIVLNQTSPRTRHTIIQMEISDFKEVVQAAR